MTNTETESSNCYSVKFAVTGGETESSPCCIFSTNLSKTAGLPEVLAVDCEPAASADVQQCLEYISNFMQNSNMVVPDLYRFTLQMDTVSPSPSSYSYFACLHVTDPDQLDALYQHRMKLEARPKSAEMVLLLMPMFAHSDSSSGLSWGQLPPIDLDVQEARMRGHIKEALEDHCLSPCGFVRSIIDGCITPTRNKKQRCGGMVASCYERVKLSEALAHCDEWKMDWEACGLKPREVQYLQKHASYFMELSIDGVSPERAAKYVAGCCCCCCSNEEE